MKKYIAPVVGSILFLITTPISIGMIFLSGDSCCGEDTRGTMLAVGIALIITAIVTAIGLNALYNLVVKNTKYKTSLLFSTLITVLPTVLVLGVFLVYMMVSA